MPYIGPSYAEYQQNQRKLNQNALQGGVQLFQAGQQVALQQQQEKRLQQNQDFQNAQLELKQLQDSTPSKTMPEVAFYFKDRFKDILQKMGQTPAQADANIQALMDKPLTREEVAGYVGPGGPYEDVPAGNATGQSFAKVAQSSETSSKFGKYLADWKPNKASEPATPQASDTPSTTPMPLVKTVSEAGTSDQSKAPVDRTWGTVAFNVAERVAQSDPNEGDAKIAFDDYRTLAKVFPLNGDTTTVDKNALAAKGTQDQKDGFSRDISTINTLRDRVWPSVIENANTKNIPVPSKWTDLSSTAQDGSYGATIGKDTYSVYIGEKPQVSANPDRPSYGSGVTMPPFTPTIRDPSGRTPATSSDVEALQNAPPILNPYARTAPQAIPEPPANQTAAVAQTPASTTTPATSSTAEVPTVTPVSKRGSAQKLVDQKMSKVSRSDPLYDVKNTAATVAALQGTTGAFLQAIQNPAERSNVTRAYMGMTQNPRYLQALAMAGDAKGVQAVQFANELKQQTAKASMELANYHVQLQIAGNSLEQSKQDTEQKKLQLGITSLQLLAYKNEAIANAQDEVGKGMIAANTAAKSDQGIKEMQDSYDLAVKSATDAREKFDAAKAAKVGNGKTKPSDDELGVLADNYNRLAGQALKLQSSLRELQKKYGITFSAPLTQWTPINKNTYSVPGFLGIHYDTSQYEYQGQEQPPKGASRPKASANPGTSATTGTSKADDLANQVTGGNP